MSRLRGLRNRIVNRAFKIKFRGLIKRGDKTKDKLLAVGSTKRQLIESAKRAEQEFVKLLPAELKKIYESYKGQSFTLDSALRYVLPENREEFLQAFWKFHDAAERIGLKESEEKALTKRLRKINVKLERPRSSGKVGALRYLTSNARVRKRLPGIQSVRKRESVTRQNWRNN